MSLKQIPSQVKANILHYLDGKSEDLSQQAQEWIRQSQGLGMTRPKELYRGLFFEKGMKINADRFLKGAKPGEFVSFPQTICSSWTSILGVARRFALNSKELIFPKMRKEFLAKVKPEDQPTGVVIAHVCTTDQVLLDVEAFSRLCGVVGKYGSEREYILYPQPSMTCRILNIYTYDLLNKEIGSKTLWGNSTYLGRDINAEFVEG